jgi:ABC-type antimicrobial peptide transport system permease subunit
MRTDFADKLEGPRVAGSIAAMTALLALGVACIGIAGVVSYVTSRRTKEIGIRLALGATSTSVVRTLLGRSAVTGALGVVFGLGGGWMVGRLFAGQPLYIEPHDAWPYAGAAITLALSATAAGLWPAIRVLRTDPLRALRVD